MIVYLFNNENVLIKINLPIKMIGMYPLNVDGRLVATILGENNKWMVQTANDFIFANSSLKKIEASPYNIFRINSIQGELGLNLILIPKYDPNVKIFNFQNEITIGNDINCDIYFPYHSLDNKVDVLKIVPEILNKSWMIDTNSSHFLINDSIAKTGYKLYNGDYVFYYGLRVIIVGAQLIINNPKNLVKLKPQNIRAISPIKDYQIYNDGNLNKNDRPIFNKSDYFFKAPRFNYIIEEQEVIIDEPPAPILENDMPIILTIGPQLTMVATSVLSMVSFLSSFVEGNTTPTRFFIALATISVTILGAILWPTLTRKFNQKRIREKEKKRREKYLIYLEQKRKQLETIKNDQKIKIQSNHPSFEECLNIINNRKKELWQRNIDHEDFLSVRLGIGKVNTKLKISIPREKFTIDDEDGLLVKMKEIVDDALTISDVPITYRFTDQNINAIVGEPLYVKEFLDCVFLQMLAYHCYTDFKIIVFTKEPSKWEYLKIVPHCWDNRRSIRYFTTSVEELTTIANDLEKIFDSRVADEEDVRLEDDGSDNNNVLDFNDFKPYYLFFIDDMSSVRNVSLINKILHYKKNMGFSLIVTSLSISNLPSETSDFICISRNESAIMTSKISDNQKQFKADFNEYNKINLYEYAKKLANIPVVVEKEKYELPSSLSFLELYNVGRVEQLNCISRWSDNNPILSLSVPIGIDQSGEVFKMDIHEKAYGPHGLVAGTTGSGKSEWIVTFILSLAVNFSPEEVQFVLIDYKGGGLAKSFENLKLNIKLPHLAGTITNLDKSEIFRSIAAIESELKRRQSVFNMAREKLKEGTMDIYKYQQYYRKGLVTEPMSHLLIICDEFAELKQQQSEFMDQLISTSRIGRSLGIHLILATQKPSGVVNEQIWSNSKFKVCLKVQDQGDSNEVLKKPDAAFLKQTGAFYLQVGNDDYYNLGQAAWAGAKYVPSDVIRKKIDTSIQYIDNIGRTIGVYEEQKSVHVSNNGDELLNIVAYISEISKQLSFKSKPLWLESLSSNISLNDLYNKYGRTTPTKFSYNIAIGEYDEPRKQKQGLLEINLSDGNVAIISQNSMDNEFLISTIIWSTLFEHSPYEVAFYIVDFGAETLKKFAKFPHVGEVVFQDEPDKVGGVLDLVIEEINKRKDILSDYNGSFEYYNKVNDKKMNLIITVINSFDIFSETFPKINDLITNLFRDATKYGVIFIVSVNSPNSLRQRQLQFFNHVLVMQLNDDSQYRNITNCRRGLIPKKNLGRGICKINSTDSNSYCEFQTACITKEKDEFNLIKNYANKCVNYYRYKVKQLATIPEDVCSDDLLKYITTLTNTPIGYNFYEKTIAKYNFLSQRIHIITGKSIRNNMNFIYGLTNILSKTPNVKVRVVDMMEVFKKPILDIKVFNDEIDVVFGALEKDAFTRKGTQDYGVNIILGVGQYKRKLSKGGIEIFSNLFSNINKSNRNIYIFIDDYDKIRTLKFEKWFDNVNLSNGIWIGKNFANQSLLTSKTVSSEDKKYDYDGLAFNLLNGEYKVIKTLMDGEE